jgi:hypothetical protein
MDAISTDTPKQLVVALHRYGGWLGKGRPAMLVRADVQALEAALDASADPSPLLLALDTSISGLPSGEIRRILRIAARRMRSALEKSS